MTPLRPGRRRVLAITLGGLLPIGRAGASPQDIKKPGAGGPRRDPKLNDEERKTLLLEMHKLIEVAADQAARRIAGREPVGVLTYPRGGTLTAAEADALSRWVAGPEALRAVRRVVADAVAGPVYDLLSMIDGAREPEGWEMPWQPFDLHVAEQGSPHGILHKAFEETYHEWQRRRPNPGWSLEGEKRDKARQ